MATTVPVYSLTVSDRDLERLQADVWNQGRVAATLAWPGGTAPAGLRHRGHYTRRLPKRSFELRFGGQGGPDGQRELHLNANYPDCSLIRSRLSFGIFAAAGVLSPVARHVWLEINGRPLGLYTAVEAVDATFLARRGLPAGNLYYAVRSVANLGLVDPHTRRRKAEVTAGYEKKHPADRDFTDLRAFLLALNLPNHAEFARSVPEWLDVHEYFGWLAVAVFICHGDGFRHNYALYHPDGAPWQIIPWDCDGTWGRTWSGRRMGPEAIPVTGDNYLSLRLLHDPDWRDCYRRRLAELLSGVLHPDAVIRQARAMHAEITPAARRDRRKWGSNADFRAELAYLEEWIGRRWREVRRELGRLD